MKKNNNATIVTGSLSGNLFVARTQHKGRGVFTTKKIKKGQIIEICPMIVFGAKDRKIINDTFLYEYYFEWGESTRKGGLALGFGSIYNHSYHPNAIYDPNFDLNILTFKSLRDIEAGEEITVSYNLDPDDKSPVWWERDKIKNKKQHP
ncbi:MAG: SET domain-containing protein-lysine N-methyltransferase [Chitinophagales bacterium]|nr:SET domain-containing protein-lysine N-methyltransferase [Chitinophagales bacterium]